MANMITDPPEDSGEEVESEYDTGLYNAEMDTVVIADLPGELDIDTKEE